MFHSFRSFFKNINVPCPAIRFKCPFTNLFFYHLARASLVALPNQEKIDWDFLAINPNAIELLKENQDKINWKYLMENPSIFKIYDYKEHINIIQKTLEIILIKK